MTGVDKVAMGCVTILEVAFLVSETITGSCLHMINYIITCVKCLCSAACDRSVIKFQNKILQCS